MGDFYSYTHAHLSFFWLLGGAIWDYRGSRRRGLDGEEGEEGKGKGRRRMVWGLVVLGTEKMSSRI